MTSDISSAEWVEQRQHARPLPYLVAEQIRAAIRQGKVKPGEQLPGEQKLAQQFSVSRATLRAAIQMLLTQGVLERRRGVGTFVTGASLLTIEEGLESLVSTTNLIRQHGYEPGTIGVRSELILATPQLQEIFQVPARTTFLHVSRTRTANKKPVIQCEEYLPTSILDPEILPGQLNDWSLYELLRQAGSPVCSAVCRIKAVSADARLAHELHVALKHPLLLLRQIHFSAAHVPILYCENYHNSSIIEFQVLRRS